METNSQFDNEQDVEIYNEDNIDESDEDEVDYETLINMHLTFPSEQSQYEGYAASTKRLLEVFNIARSLGSEVLALRLETSYKIRFSMRFAKQFAELLQVCRCIQFLDTSNLLNSTTFCIVVSSLPMLQSLTVLKLNCVDPVSAEDAIVLSSAFSSFHSLKELNLISLKCTDDGVHMILASLHHHPFLMSISLGHTHISRRGCIGLQQTMQMIDSLTSIKFIQSSFDEEMLELLSLGFMNQKDLQELNINTEQLTSTGFKALGNILLHISLIELTLAATALGDDGISLLKKGLLSQTRLQRLNLFRFEATSAGARDLSDVLHAVTTLQWLDISHSYYLGDDGLRILLPSLCSHKSLRVMEVYACGMMKATLMHMVMLIMKQQPSSLETLDIDSIFRDDPYISVLYSRKASLTLLNMYDALDIKEKGSELLDM